MYSEPPIPADATTEEAHRLKQFVLSAGDVAAALNVTQQAISYRTLRGDIPVIREAPGPGRKQSWNRYDLAGVVALSHLVGEKVRVDRLPLRLILQYDMGPLSDNPDRVIFAQDNADGPSWLAEAEAAKLLKIRRQSLRDYRVKGQLNPAIKLRAREGLPGVQYATDDVLAVIEERMELLGDLESETAVSGREDER
jgi:hypothetical protein